MALKKSELYSSLWKSCDELRGGMDASQYKDYVLVLLFVKYVSDKAAGNAQALIEVPTGGRFADMVALKGDADADDERKILNKYLALVENLAASNKKSKNAGKKLEVEISAKYGKLSVDEIKRLVVDDKWFAAIAAAVQSELDRVSQKLTGRVKELAERYATPLPDLIDELAVLTARVDGHLGKMGVVY